MIPLDDLTPGYYVAAQVNYRNPRLEIVEYVGPSAGAPGGVIRIGDYRVHALTTPSNPRYPKEIIHWQFYARVELPDPFGGEA